VFEQIYFARPDSVVFGESVHRARYQWGRELAAVAPVEADVVISVPDSGNPAALGYAAGSGIPFDFGLIRSHYGGRTFLAPEQAKRDLGVRLKLSPVKEVVEGKRVVVVDDSVVRGTTSKKILRLLRDAGSAEVHLRSGAPPVVGPCHYGVATPTYEELLAHRMTLEESRVWMGADSLAYLPLNAVTRPGFCHGCFSGEYVLS
jgi:amidophosphoribosyltransferase